MKNYIHLYINHDLEELVKQIQSDIKYHGLAGNSVALTCSLSQLGCCQILLSNYYEARVILQFLREDLDKGKYEGIELAMVLRFLGLYSVFEGEVDQALTYYCNSQEIFVKYDALEDEAVMLIEAFFWLYQLCDYDEGIFYVIERLKWIKEKSSELEKAIDIFLAKTPSRKLDLGERFWHRLFIHTQQVDSKGNNKLLFLTIPNQFKELFNYINENKDRLLVQSAYKLKAQVEQFKHPWYKAFGYLFIGFSLQRLDLIIGAKELFEKQLLSPLVELCEEIMSTRKIPKDFFITPIKLQQTTPKNEIVQREIKYRFTIFHTFKIMLNDVEINYINLKRKKAEEILIYMLLHPNLQVDKEIVLEEFYPEIDIKKASNRLYVLIHEINKNFNHSFISIVNGRVTLNRALIEEIDSQNYNKLFSVGSKLWIEDQISAVELYEKAIKIYGKQIVPHLLYSPWLDQVRENLKSKQVYMLKRLFFYYKHPSEKERILFHYYECDPLDEFMIKEYILLLQRQKRNEEAKDLFQKYSKLFEEELEELPAEIKTLLQ